MDLTYYNEDNTKVLNCRVGLLINNKDKYLVQHFADSGHYSLLGGRIKFNETSMEAAIRECEEETEIRINENDLKFITIVENFFEYNKKSYHELLFLYEVNNEKINKLGDHKCKDKPANINSWKTKDELLKLDLKPKALYKIFNNELSTPFFYRDK